MPGVVTAVQKQPQRAEDALGTQGGYLEQLPFAALQSPSDIKLGPRRRWGLRSDSAEKKFTSMSWHRAKTGVKLACFLGRACPSHWHSYLEVLIEEIYQSGCVFVGPFVSKELDATKRICTAARKLPAAEFW